MLIDGCLLVPFQVFEFPGGAIQWARYRNDVKDYLSIEEEAFGSSLNSQRSHMTLGTLRIKSNGLRAPHWHFNANEHGYLAQVQPACPACCTRVFKLCVLKLLFSLLQSLLNSVTDGIQALAVCSVRSVSSAFKH